MIIDYQYLQTLVLYYYKMHIPHEGARNETRSLERTATPERRIPISALIHPSRQNDSASTMSLDSILNLEIQIRGITAVQKHKETTTLTFTDLKDHSANHLYLQTVKGPRAKTAQGRRILRGKGMRERHTITTHIHKKRGTGSSICGKIVAPREEKRRNGQI